MQIETKNFGAIEVQEDQVLTFAQGLYAFEEKKRYVLFRK